MALCFIAFLFFAPAAAQEKPPANVEALINLLADPGVQKWLNDHKSATPAPPARQETTGAAGAQVSEALTRVRGHLHRVALAIPALPEEFARGLGRLSADASHLGWTGFAALILVVAAFAIGCRQLYLRATATLRGYTGPNAAGDVRGRVRAVLSRLVLDLGSALALALGGVVALLLVEWPALLKEVVLTVLLVIVSIGIAKAVLRSFLCPPGGPDAARAQLLRLLPVDDARAAFWYTWLGGAVMVFAVGYGLVHCVRLLGFSADGSSAVAYALGLGLLALGIAMVWQARPTAEPSISNLPYVGRSLRASLLTLYFIALWLAWAAGAMRLFWLLAVALALPLAMRLSRRVTAHLLRPSDAGSPGQPIPSIGAVCFDRGVRAALIVGAVLFLAWAWDIDLVDLTASDTLATRTVRGVMSAVIILLVADFLWQVARTLLDTQIASVREPGELGTPEAHRRARLRTLLPILRNVSLAVLAVVAVLMALSALGVEIGPLIAGAGVIGVAVGFGAQTLVKDIISGMFYLLDDAFRVGEYIESGKFKGNVESFSLRSVKLRHPRGPIYTVPFGELGAVQNMSRDWVIEKIPLNLTYDSDVDKARKLIKKIGLELAQDPEFKDSTIEPLKMQGVDNFGDYAIQIRLKLKTKPGEQFGIKRRALMMIKQAFEENGIKFAQPVVQVAGTPSADAAAVAAAHGASEALKRELAAQEA